jgi:hypothetical protein
MKLLATFVLIIAVSGCSSLRIDHSNSSLRNALQRSAKVTIRDWRLPDGKTITLSAHESEEFTAGIEFQRREISAGDYCQCIGDFRVTFEATDGGSSTFFVCHWQHLSIGDELKVERQVYLKPESQRRVKSFLLARFPARPGEEKEANQRSQRNASIMSLSTSISPVRRG